MNILVLTKQPVAYATGCMISQTRDLQFGFNTLSLRYKRWERGTFAGADLRKHADTFEGSSHTRPRAFKCPAEWLRRYIRSFGTNSF